MTSPVPGRTPPVKPSTVMMARRISPPTLPTPTRKFQADVSGLNYKNKKDSQNLQKKKEYGILYLSGRNSTDLPDHIIIFSFKFYNGGMVWCTLRLSSLTVSCACQVSRSRGNPEGFPGTVVGADMASGLNADEPQCQR